MTNNEPTRHNTSTPLLRRLAGGALLATPLLMFGAMVTSPPQADDSSAAYLASLAADWNLSILSANLFHYYWVLLALAVPAAVTLLRGPRGRTLTAIGVAGAALGAIQMSGLLFADWMNAAMPTVVTLDQAVAVFEKIDASASMGAWKMSGIVLGIAMPAVVLAGLARNGVIGWWATPVVVLPMIAGPVVGGFAGAVIGSLVGALCCAPLLVVGVRLLRRTAADVTAVERDAAARAPHMV
jgi:hypothetical protein